MDSAAERQRAAAAHPESANSAAATTRKRKYDGGKSIDPQDPAVSQMVMDSSGKPKLQKACLNCRRAKLKCDLVKPGGPCKRCVSQKTECRFRTRAHDDDWQASVNSSLSYLHGRVSQLAGAIDSILDRIGLPPQNSHEPPHSGSSLVDLSPPQNQAAATQFYRRQHDSSTSSPMFAHQALPPPPHHHPPPPPHIHPNQQQQQHIIPPSSFAPRSGSSNPSPSQQQHHQLARHHHPPPIHHQHPHNNNTSPSTNSQSPSLHVSRSEDGIDAFDFDILMPSGAKALLLRSERETKLDPPPAHAISGAPSFFKTLEELEGDYVAQPGAQAVNSTDPSPRPNVGSNDPRPDIVSTKVISSTDAELLLDHFHSDFSLYFFGFPLRFGQWPYLVVGGKEVITPLILSSICMIASERVETFHPLMPPCATHFEHLCTGLRVDWDDGNEEDELDLELGVGAEEIAGLCLAATFGDTSTACKRASAAFRWTRGLLRTFMLPGPPPLTVGEVCGFLTPRRSLNLVQWLRLWLIAYVVHSQQAFFDHQPLPHREFDPAFYCSSLIGLGASDEVALDYHLASHAEMCSLLIRVRRHMDSQEWLSPTDHHICKQVEIWNEDLEKWMNESVTRHAFDITAATNLWPLLSIKVMYFFAQTYINQAALHSLSINSPLSARAISSERWQLVAKAAVAARALLRLVVEEGKLRAVLPLLPTVYVKMVSLAAACMLKLLHFAPHIPIPDMRHEATILAQTIAQDLVRRTCETLKSGPLPLQHLSRDIARSLEGVMQATNTTT